MEGLPGRGLLLIGFHQDDACFYGAEAETQFEIFDDRRGHSICASGATGSGRNCRAAVDSEMEGYTLLAAGLGHEPRIRKPETTLFVHGTNLLEKTVRHHASFLKDRAPVPGQSATMGITAEF